VSIFELKLIDEEVTPHTIQKSWEPS